MKTPMEDALRMPEYAEFGAQIEGYSARLLGDPDRARDVTQEAFVRLWQGKRQDEQNTRAWLYRVARNLCIDCLRREARYTRMEDSALLYAREEEDPARQAGDREERQIMLQQLEQLPPKQQEALRLKFQENLTYAQIAEVTGDTVATVGWHLHEALKSLRGQLAR